MAVSNNLNTDEKVRSEINFSHFYFPLFVVAEAIFASVGAKPVATIALSLMIVIVLFRKITLKLEVKRRISVEYIFFGIYSFIVSQYLSNWYIIDRDPGFYLLGAKWLDQTNYFNVNLTGLTTIRDFTFSSPGINPSVFNPEIYNFQGGIALPALIHGLNILTTNITYSFAIILFFATISTYQFAINFLDRHYALFFTLLLGVSLPFLYISTAPLSELIALPLLLNLYTLTLKVIEKATKVNLSIIFVNAIALGASRIDGLLLAITPFCIFIILSIKYVKAFPRKPLIALTLGLLTGNLLLLINSSAYFIALKREYLITIFIFLLSLILAFLAKRISTKKHTILIKIIIYTSMSLASIEIARFFITPLNSKLSQSFRNLPFYTDGDKYTLVSFGYYYGLLPLVFFVIAFVRFRKYPSLNSNIMHLFLLAIIIVQVNGYLIGWAAAPDQPWASRRLIQGAYPIMLMFFFLEFEKFRDRFKKNQIYTWSINIIVFLNIMLVSFSFWTNLQYKNVDAAIVKLCNEYSITKNKNTLVILDKPSSIFSQSLRSFCGVNTYNAIDANTDVIVESRIISDLQGIDKVIAIYGGLPRESLDKSVRIPVQNLRISSLFEKSHWHSDLVTISVHIEKSKS